MNTELAKPMTLQEFLVWEEKQELRYEFDGFRPVAMAGGTEAHAAIQRNLIFSLTGRLRGRACRPYGSDLKIQVAGHIRYPEAFVVCTPVAPRATVVTDPVVVFEVVSNRSVHDDMVVKLAEYCATPSIQRYIVLHQTHVGATVYFRHGEDWIREQISGNGVLLMPEIGIAVPLAELYIDVGLSASDAENSGTA